MKPNWFIGLPVPGNWLPDVTASMPVVCRGFVPEDLHLTVAFFGALDLATGRAMEQHLQKVKADPFSISLGALIPLPRRKRPSALSFALQEGKEPASQLIAQWRAPLLSAAGARPDHRPPLPHITIARPIRKYGFQGREQALAWCDALVPPEVSVEINTIALYTWAEDRTVRQFQIVSEKRLDA